MNDILSIFREVARTQEGGVVTVTEIVDAAVLETGGSREYIIRKVRDTLRELGRKGKLVSMRKRIPTAAGGTALVPAYKEKK